jgi:BlaI family penicillinase repressor
MDKRRRLTEFQLKIMDILWRRGEATINQVHDELKDDKQVARATVATMLIRLERQGVVGVRKHDVLNVYYPLIGRKEIKRTMLLQLVDSLFEGDSADLVCHLLQEGEYSSEDIKRIAAMIRDFEARGGRT